MSMDMKALFKINCGLYITAVELDGNFNGCITNTLMQQSHVPVRFSLTVEKTHLTHDMIAEKKSVTVSALARNVTVDLIRHFGFVSGREKKKFEDFPYTTDQNGNPLPQSDQIAAAFSLNVYDTVDIGTHTLFLCEPVLMQDYPAEAITYGQYQASLKKK